MELGHGDVRRPAGDGPSPLCGGWQVWERATTPRSPFPALPSPCPLSRAALRFPRSPASVEAPERFESALRVSALKRDELELVASAEGMDLTDLVKRMALERRRAVGFIDQDTGLAETGELEAELTPAQVEVRRAEPPSSVPAHPPPRPGRARSPTEKP